MSTDKKDKKTKPKTKNRLQKGFDEFKSDVDKLRKGKLKPRIFKEDKTLPGKPMKKLARSMTGKGGDPKSTPVKDTAVQRPLKALSRKLLGKDTTSSTTKPKTKKTTKKKTTKK